MFKRLRFQIEITPLCNAKCRGCCRFIPGTDIDNPLLPKGKDAHMDLDFFKKIFSEPEIREATEYIVFSGPYGDCTMHPQLKEFAEYVLEFANLRIETNGALRTPEWWEAFADPRIYVEFALDGLDNETHTRYRRGLKLDDVLANAQAFIKGGGKAAWAMIEHDHNKDHIARAKEMAKDMGFYEFKLKRSRITNYTKFDGSTTKKYQKSDIESKKYKKIPIQQVDVEFNNKEVQAVKNIAEELGYQSQEEYDNFTEIVCSWGNAWKYNINHRGILMRCCHFDSFYFTSPNEKDIANNDMVAGITRERSQGYKYYLDKYEPYWNHLSHHSMTEILNHPFYTKDLPDSFDNPGSVSENPRIINKCSKYCGEIPTLYRERRDNESF